MVRENSENLCVSFFYHSEWDILVPARYEKLSENQDTLVRRPRLHTSDRLLLEVVREVTLVS